MYPDCEIETIIMHVYFIQVHFYVQKSWNVPTSNLHERRKQYIVDLVRITSSMALRTARTRETMTFNTQCVNGHMYLHFEYFS